MNTNTQLLEKYDVKFYKRKSDFGFIEYSATGGGLANFLRFFTDLDAIDEGLNNIDYYLSGEVDDYERNTLSSEMFTAWLDSDSADIYPSTGNTENLLQSIPLNDFKIILQQWLLFING